MSGEILSRIFIVVKINYIVKKTWEIDFHNAFPSSAADGDVILGSWINKIDLIMFY